MLTMRLIVGWTWEVVFKQIFELIATAEEENQQLNTGLQCLLAACIVALALYLHLQIKDWDRPADLFEEEETPENTAAAVGGSASTDVVGSNSSAAPVSEVIVDSETRSPLN